MLEERRREKALQEALETAFRSQLPERLKTLMQSRGEEIAEYFLAHWGRPSTLFLYLSPLLDITSQPGTPKQKYRFKIEFSSTGNLTAHSVSRAPLKPDFNEIEPWWDNYYAQLRWSIPFPLFTPFDAYHAYLDVVGEIFISSWRLATQRTTLTGRTKQWLADLAEHFSTIAALLRMDYHAGFSGASPEFNEAQAISDREVAIVRIFELVDKKIVPLVDALKKEGILDPDVIVVSQRTSALHHRLQELLTAERSVSHYLLRLANDLSSIPKKALGYQRRESLTLEQRWGAFEAYKRQYFRELVANVWEHLPEAARVPTFDVSNVTGGEIQLETFEPFSE